MNMKRLRTIMLAAALSIGAAGVAAAAPYTTLDPQASSIAFGYRQMNVKMDGGFSEITATGCQSDPVKPEVASVTREVRLASIDAGYSDANDELKKAAWLDMAQHPVATFRSTRVEPLGEGRYPVTGEP